MKPRGILRARRRRGAAVVEMAIVAPLLLTMLFGIIEFGWVFSIKQAFTNAAREGCRVATMEGSTDTMIKNSINTYLSSTGLAAADYETTLTHATLGDPTEVVTIRVPYRQVSLMGGFFSRGTETDWTIGSTCTMRKEGVTD